MPSGTFSGLAEDLSDAAERARALRRILKNAGLSAFTEGVNPWRATDDELLRKTAAKPVVRFAVDGLRPGPGDPGGWAWLWLPAAVVAAAAIAARLAAARVQRVRRQRGRRVQLRLGG
jgi:hypothetical protein